MRLANNMIIAIEFEESVLGQSAVTSLLVTILKNTLIWMHLT